MRTAISLLLSLLVTPALAEDTLKADFERMMRWFPGEYDNTPQVEAERAPGQREVHEHIFHIFIPVSAAAIGEHTVFVKQYMDGNYEDVYRQRLYAFSADAATDSVKLVIYSFRDDTAYAATGDR